MRDEKDSIQTPETLKNIANKLMKLGGEVHAIAEEMKENNLSDKVLPRIKSLFVGIRGIHTFVTSTMRAKFDFEVDRGDYGKIIDEAPKRQPKKAKIKKE